MSVSSLCLGVVFGGGVLKRNMQLNNIARQKIKRWKPKNYVGTEWMGMERQCGKAGGSNRERRGKETVMIVDRVGFTTGSWWHHGWILGNIYIGKTICLSLDAHVHPHPSFFFFLFSFFHSHKKANLCNHTKYADLLLAQFWLRCTECVYCLCRHMIYSDFAHGWINSLIYPITKLALTLLPTVTPSPFLSLIFFLLVLPFSSHCSLFFCLQV